MTTFNKVFICFAAEDRYDIAEPIVYHLKNYGINVWYDRQSLLLGDNRIEKNLNEGAGECAYAITIISHNTEDSVCTMEELSIIKSRYKKNDIIVFPILYEIKPNDIPNELKWIKQIIFKEVNRNSGTRDICNHVACKITDDILSKYNYRSVREILRICPKDLPNTVIELIDSYYLVDENNLNCRVALLYATYLVIINYHNDKSNPLYNLITKIFERLFSETRLNIEIDYRELWLLENSICILINNYLNYCVESKI